MAKSYAKNRPLKPDQYCDANGEPAVFSLRFRSIADTGRAPNFEEVDSQ
jgi:hypothetical protein